MWKKLGGSLAVLVAVIAVGLWLVLAHLDGDVLAAIEQDGSVATGTKVTVGSVYLSLLRGICVISGLTVDNPPGFSTPYALSLGEITIHGSTRSLVAAVLDGSNLPGRGFFGGPIVIDEVNIDRPHIFYEVSGDGAALSLKSLNLGATSNLAALQQGAKAIAVKNPDQGPPQKQIIRSLDVAGGKVSVFTSLLKGRLLVEKLPLIHLSGIGAATGGVTTGQVCGQVLTAISEQAELEGAASLVKAIGSAATGPLGGAIVNKIKSLF
jgi:hypothetical protein